MPQGRSPSSFFVSASRRSSGAPLSSAKATIGKAPPVGDRRARTRRCRRPGSSAPARSAGAASAIAPAAHPRRSAAHRLRCAVILDRAVDRLQHGGDVPVLLSPRRREADVLADRQQAGGGIAPAHRLGGDQRPQPGEAEAVAAARPARARRRGRGEPGCGSIRRARRRRPRPFRCRRGCRSEFAAPAGSSTSSMRSSWLSSTPPATPTALQAAATCGVRPPRRYSGRPVRPSHFCSRMKLLSSPTKPPASLPLRSSPSTRSSGAPPASGVRTSASTLTPARRISPTSAAHCDSDSRSRISQLKPRATNGRSASTCPAARAPTFRPKRPRAWVARTASSRSTGRKSRASSALSTPTPPAREPEIASEASRSPAGARTNLTKSAIALSCGGGAGEKGGNAGAKTHSCASDFLTEIPCLQLVREPVCKALSSKA